MCGMPFKGKELMYSFFFPVQWNVHVVEGARTATVGPRYKLHIRDNKTTRWNKPGFQKNTTVYHTWNMFTGTVMQVRNKPLHHFSTVILASVTCNRNLSVPPCLGFQQQGKLFLIFFLCQSFCGIWEEATLPPAPIPEMISKTGGILYYNNIT